MESWRKVWRDGLAPLLSTPGVEALQRALTSDDGRLLQGATSAPPPLACVQDWPVEAACPIGFSAWQGDGLETVAEIEEYFARTCFEVDQRIGEPAGCRWFLNWWDEMPREEARQQFLAEVQRELANRRRHDGERRDGRGMSPVERGGSTHFSRGISMICRHCRQHRANRPRGLCWTCYYTPGVRERYPSTSKFARRGVEDRTGLSAPPPTPTAARPGSPEKVAILEERARLQQALWHPQDAPMDHESRGLGIR